MTNPNPSIQDQIEEKAMSCAGYVNPIASARETGYMVKDFYESRIQDLEKVNDHLEEGCNERGKRIKELESDIQSLDEIINRRDQSIQELEKEIERLTILLRQSVAGGDGDSYNFYKWGNYVKDNNIQPIK